MSYQIFISYRRNGGAATAYLIKEHLQHAGYNVFLDVDSLGGGQFNKEILKSIDECESVIVILSSHALDRATDQGDWVFQEISYALEKKKRIVPVFENDFVWPEELPDEIKDMKYYNGAKVDYNFFDGFIEKVCRLLETKNVDYSKSSDLRHLLIWGDFEYNILSKISKRLELPDNFCVEILTEPIEIVSRKLFSDDILLLINTDVTKLANDDLSLKRINEVIEKFVLDGGKIIATHDIIYRRTRNKILQNMYGCTITAFEKTNSVKYIKNVDTCNSEFSNLPDEFELHDDEICWGEMSPDLDVYFKSEKGVPLVFSREYGSGVCIWLNSGDYSKYPSASILKPEQDFIKLLKACIDLRY